MEPTFHTGDIVISMKAPDYKVGDIVAYEVSDKTIGTGRHVIHRIIGITEKNGSPVYSTRGDNNPSDDPWTVTKHDVFGKQLVVIPKVGSFFLSSQGPTALGAVLAIVVVLAIWPSPSKHSKHSSSTKPDSDTN